MAGMGRQGNPALSNDYSANPFGSTMGRNGQQSHDYMGGVESGSEATEKKSFIDASRKVDKNSNKGCGVPNREPDKDEIIGGRVADPHAFPWMVRIEGGCAKTVCGGALITNKHILTSFFCAINKKESRTTPCDHSDEKRVAIMGQNSLRTQDVDGAKTVPLIDVKYPSPKNVPFDPKNNGKDGLRTHSFAMYILKTPVVFSNNIAPICLPVQSTRNRYSGKEAVAAGWGRFYPKQHGVDWTGTQSDLLKQVNLMVTNTTYKHYKMFGTEVDFKDGLEQDPCAGDGGGPLMYYYRTLNRWVIIGTLWGAGYDCRTDTKSGMEGYEEGIWNKVSYHTDWILKWINPETDDDDDDKDDSKDKDDSDDSDDSDEDKKTKKTSSFLSSKNGSLFLVNPPRSTNDVQRGPGQDRPGQVFSEGGDYSINQGPQYGQAGFMG